MKVIVPVAGLGTRLKPHTYSKPKPLLTVAGKPVLGHILDMFNGKKYVEEVIFITGYMGEMIEQYVKANYPFRSRFIEQKELKGQADAVYLARDFVDKDCMIIFSDTLVDIKEADPDTLPNIREDGLIFVKEVKDPRRFGVVVTDQAGRVTEFIEKPDEPVSNNVNIGLYYVKNSQKMFRAIEQLVQRKIQTQGEYFLVDAFNIMINQGQVFTTRTVDVWLEAGKPDTMLSTNRYLLEHGHSNRPKANGNIIIQPVFIAASADIEGSIIGPCVTVGENSVIRHSIVSDSIIDSYSTIQHAILHRSLIGSNAKVRGTSHILNVGDSSQVDFVQQEPGKK